MSATQNAVSPKIEIETEWVNQSGQYRTFRVWLTEGWSQSFLQVNKGAGWVTLY